MHELRNALGLLLNINLLAVWQRLIWYVVYTFFTRVDIKQISFVSHCVLFLKLGVLLADLDLVNLINTAAIKAGAALITFTLSGIGIGNT